MTALRFQTGGRHQTFPASLRGGAEMTVAECFMTSCVSTLCLFHNIHIITKPSYWQHFQIIGSFRCRHNLTRTEAIDFSWKHRRLRCAETIAWGNSSPFSLTTPSQTDSGQLSWLILPDQWPPETCQWKHEWPLLTTSASYLLKSDRYELIGISIPDVTPCCAT